MKAPNFRTPKTCYHCRSLDHDEDRLRNPWCIKYDEERASPDGGICDSFEWNPIWKPESEGGN